MNKDVRLIKIMALTRPQKNLFLDFDQSLNDMIDDDNHNLDLVVQMIRKFVAQVVGIRLKNIIEPKKYIVSHYDMEKIITHKLKQVGMSGATEYDKYILAEEMLNVPIRDYYARYYVSPLYAPLSNLNHDHGAAIYALWYQILHTLDAYYAMQEVSPIR